MAFRVKVRRKIEDNSGDLEGILEQYNRKDVGKATDEDDGHTLLLWAVKKGSFKSVQSLLRFGIDINQRGTTGVTPLLLATYLGNFEIVKSLVNHEKRSLEYADVYGHQPLSIAAQQGHFDMVAFFLENGADVKKPNIQNETPLMLAIKAHHLKIVDLLLSTTKENFAMVVAVRSGSVAMVQCLIDKKVDVNETNNEKTPLAWAASEGYLEIARVLIDNVADVNLCSPDGNTPLATAVQRKQLEMAKYLITKGANVCKTDKKGKMPLNWAVQNKDLDMVKLLLDNGAEYIVDSVLMQAIETKNLNTVQRLKEGGALLNVPQSEGGQHKTPLAKSLEVGSVRIAKYLVENGAVEEKTERLMALLWAVKKQNIDMVKFLLDHGAKSEVDAVFLEAIATGSLEIVQLLKDGGAHLNTSNESSVILMTPLMKALDVGSIEISKYLIENGAKVVEELGKSEISYIIRFVGMKNFEMIKLLTEHGARLNILGNCGHTVLTKSVQMENFEMVKYFVDHGAKVNQVDKNQQTPLMIAASINEFQIFQYLVDCGAVISEDLSIDDDDRVKLLRYYNKAKGNRLKKGKPKTVSEISSGEESVKVESIS